jgi:hypothetical protein
VVNQLYRFEKLDSRDPRPRCNLVPVADQSTKTTKNDGLRQAVLITDESIQQLNRDLGKAGWGSMLASVELKDGREITRLSMEDLDAISPEEWESCVDLTLRWGHVDGAGATVWFRTPASLFSSQNSRYLISGSNHAIVLHAQELIDRFSGQRSKLYTFFSKRWIWFLLTQNWPFFIRLFTLHRIDPKPWIGVLALAVNTVAFVIWAFLPRLIPNVRLLLGSSRRKLEASRLTSQRSSSWAFDILKLLLGGAITLVVVWLTHYLHLK